MMHFCAESIIHLFWSAGEEESEKKDDEDKKEEKEELLEPGKEGEEDIKKDENELGKLKIQIKSCI